MLMKKINYIYLILGFIFLAIMIFVSRNFEINVVIISAFIVPIGFIISKGFYTGKSLFSSDMKILISLTLGAIIVSLLSRNTAATIILSKTISIIFSAGTIAIILYLNRKKYR